MKQRPGQSRSLPKATAVGCVLVLTMAGSVGCTSEGDDSPGSTAPIAPTRSATLAPERAAIRSLDPDGFAGLRLGMSVDEVRSTGAVALHEDVAGPCRTFTLTGADLPAARADSETDGFVSKEYGLVAVFARPRMRTPEGLGVGSTVEELRAAYPAGGFESGWFRAPLGGGREYEFGLGPGNTVESLSIRMITQDCFS